MGPASVRLGGKRTLGHPKCGVIFHLAAARLLFEFEPLEILWRHLGQAKIGVGSESEATIISRLSGGPRTLSSLGLEASPSQPR